MQKTTENLGIFHHILSRQQIGYALVDDQLMIQSSNEFMKTWSQNPFIDIDSRSILDILPELVGIEKLLVNMDREDFETFFIPSIYRQDIEGQDRYFDLRIEPFCLNKASYLITAVDVTYQMNREQKLRQQRNDLYLHLEKFRAANTHLTQLLTGFMPQQVAQDLINRHAKPQFRGEGARNTTILFADMRDFTAAAEIHSPAETLHILNRYFGLIIPPILTAGGSIIQIVGDMLMASFNNPADQPDHAYLAVKTAYEINQRIEQFLLYEKPDFLPALRFGIGVNSGFTSIGYLGSAERFRLAVVGDATNVAFHLCSRANGGQIIISQTTLDQIQGLVNVRSLGMASLKRRQEQLMLYELEAVYEPEDYHL